MSSKFGGLTAIQRAILAGLSTVKTFGAKCDLVCLMNVSVTAGSDVLVSADASFQVADIGKTIGITGAGVSIGASVADGVTLYGPHVSTIVEVQSSTQVRMAAAASRSVSTAAQTGIQYVSLNATAQAGAKAFYGTDDTAAIQDAVDKLHPLDGIVRIPAPGCMVLGSIYCQRSRNTGSQGLLWRRLQFLGVGPTAQGPLSGAANPNDSNLFKPTPGPILTVNLDAAGAGMTSSGATPTHQFYNFNVQYIAFHGLPGLSTVGMKLHRTRASVYDCTFNNLALGWNAMDPDVNLSPNYSDQWTVRRVKFNNCAGAFRQYDPDACEFVNLYGESWYPSVQNVIEMTGGRGWRIVTPLFNKLPRSARIGLFNSTKEGVVTGGHFEDCWGAGFRIEGTNGNTNAWVDIQRCDWFNPAATAGITSHTIEYTAAGGTVENCGFSHNRTGGFDIKFNSARHQIERNNHFYEADNSTRRYPSVDITVAGGNAATTFRQPYFVNVVWVPGGNGKNFDLRNINGSTVLANYFTGNPNFDTATGVLNLDGAAKWGRPNLAIAVRKAGKYEPRVRDVYTLTLEFYDDAGAKVMTPDANCECWLFVS